MKITYIGRRHWSVFDTKDEQKRRERYGNIIGKLEKCGVRERIKQE